MSTDIPFHQMGNISWDENIPWIKNDLRYGFNPNYVTNIKYGKESNNTLIQ